MESEGEVIKGGVCVFQSMIKGESVDMWLSLMSTQEKPEMYCLLLTNMTCKFMVFVLILSLMDSPCQDVSNGMWHAMWFLMVCEISSFEIEGPNLWEKTPKGV